MSRRDFYLFGSPIAMSMSPAMHNAGFGHLGIEGHVYSLFETAESASVKSAVESVTFGGASVTVPLKLDVVPLCGRLTEAAERIGAVNTLVIEQDDDCDNGKDDGGDDDDDDDDDDDAKNGTCANVGQGKRLLGDNTDWLGIRNPIYDALAPFIESGKAKGKSYSMLIIGAGGTARAAIFAARKLNLTAIVCNRTVAKAITLRDEFASLFAEDDTDGGDNDKIAGSGAVSIHAVPDQVSARELIDSGKVPPILAVMSAVPSTSGITLDPRLFPCAEGIDIEAIMQNQRETDHGNENASSDEKWTAFEERAIPLVVLDAAYHPRPTKLLRQAQIMGCVAVEGAEMLVAQGVEQFQRWTKRDPPNEVMRKAVFDVVFERERKEKEKE